MALTIVTRTVPTSGAEVEFYLATTVEGAEFGILIDGLDSIDVAQLEDIDATGTGVDLQAKMEGFKLKTNGQPALETYGRLIVDIDGYVSARDISAIRGSAPSAISALGDRVTALEAPA